MSIGCRVVVVLSLVSGACGYYSKHGPDDLPDAPRAIDARPIDAGPAADAPFATLDPVVLADHQLSPLAIAVAGGRVYWSTDDGKIQSVPVGGGPTVTHATGQAVPRSLIVDGGDLYWVNSPVQPVGQVVTVPIAGGEPRVLAGMQNHPVQIAAQSGQLYWTNAVGDNVVTMPEAGGDVTPLAIRQAAPQALAVDADALYWSSPTDQELRTQPRIDGLEHQKAIATGLRVGTIFVLGGVVFFGSSGATGADGHVYQVLPGEAPQIIADSPAPSGIVADASHVYWTDPLRGTVMRVARSGGEPELLVGSQPNPTHLAIDRNNIYWLTDLPEGSIIQRAK